MKCTPITPNAAVFVQKPTQIPPAVGMTHKQSFAAACVDAMAGPLAGNASLLVAKKVNLSLHLGAGVG
ncbi:MAG TPA: hypothetical protein VLR89_10285 [Anaerolineaceae bacterium]|nr:hypothetical protein [Anaerolineaceae bacterium]